MRCGTRLARLAPTVNRLAAHGAALLAASAIAAAFPPSALTKPGDATQTAGDPEGEVQLQQGPETTAQASPEQAAVTGSPGISDGQGQQQTDSGAGAAREVSTPPPGGEGDQIEIPAADRGLADGHGPDRSSDAAPVPHAAPAASVTAAPESDRARSQHTPYTADGGTVRSLSPRAEGTQNGGPQPAEPSGCEFATVDGPLIQGTPGDDLLSGSPGNDLICGFGGNDRINGGAGDDRIDGGEGNDQIDGAEGNDCLVGGGGDDHVSGGLGDDLIDGRAGNDQLFGDEGNDTLQGGGGQDVLFGGQGFDAADGTLVDQEPFAENVERSFEVRGECIRNDVLGGGDSGDDASRRGGGGEAGGGQLGDVVGGTAGFVASRVRGLTGGDEAEAATPSPPLPPFVVTISESPVTLKGRLVPVLVTCSGGFLRAAGTLALSTPERRGTRPRKLGSERFECTPFAPTLVAVRLSDRNRRFVERERRLRVRARVLARDLSGQEARARAVFSVRAPRR